MWPVGHASEHIETLVGSFRWTVLEHGGIIGRDEPVLGRTSVALESSPALAGPSSMTRVMLTIEVNKSTTQAPDDRNNLVWSSTIKIQNTECRRGGSECSNHGRARRFD